MYIIQSTFQCRPCTTYSLQTAEILFYYSALIVLKKTMLLSFRPDLLACPPCPPRPLTARLSHLICSSGRPPVSVPCLPPPPSFACPPHYSPVCPFASSSAPRPALLSRPALVPLRPVPLCPARLLLYVYNWKRRDGKRKKRTKTIECVPVAPLSHLVLMSHLHWPRLAPSYLLIVVLHKHTAEEQEEEESGKNKKQKKTHPPDPPTCRPPLLSPITSCCYSTEKRRPEMKLRERVT